MLSAETVFVGVDMGKDAHYAHAVGSGGQELFDRPVANDEVAIRELIGQAAGWGRVVLVIDQPSSTAQLLLAVARQQDVPVAYVTGLQMRRASELYAGSAKTDPRDAFVLADSARRNADRLTWLAVSDELLAELRILNGRDVDLAEDANRTVNRIRDALLSISPSLERALGDRLHQPGVRDLLEAYPTPTALRRAGRTRIRKRIARRSPRIAAKVTEAVWAALDAQTLTLPAEQRWGQVIADLVCDLQRIHTQRQTLATDIEEVFLRSARSWSASAGSGPGPEPEPSPRSATPTGSQTEHDSPPTAG